MSRFPLACQTITFGPHQNERFPEIFRKVREAGYSGVEIGFRHLERIPPADLRLSLSSFSLSLVAVHLSGDLFATDEHDRPYIDRVIEYVRTAGAKRILYSGLVWESSDQFTGDLDALNKAAHRCAASEVQLCYHNHAHEFCEIPTPGGAAGGMRLIDAIIDGATPELRFAPDIGWVHKAGADPLVFLAHVRDGLSVVHYKDFATREPVSGDAPVDTVPLGTGCVPLKSVTKWLRKNIRGLWIVAEQDVSSCAPEDAIRRNASFLRKSFAG